MLAFGLTDRQTDRKTDEETRNTNKLITNQVKRLPVWVCGWRSLYLPRQRRSREWRTFRACRRTDRQTDRQTDKHTDTQPGEAFTCLGMRMEEPLLATPAEKSCMEDASCLPVRQTDRQTDRQKDRQTDRQTDGLTGRQTDRQTDRQT